MNAEQSCAVARDTKLETGDLGRIEIHRDDPACAGPRKGQGVIAGRGDRQHGIAGGEIEALQQDVGIFPALGVANAIETDPV